MHNRPVVELVREPVHHPGSNASGSFDTEASRMKGTQESLVSVDKPDDIEVRPLQESDLHDLLDLWSAEGSLRIASSDNFSELSLYLNRNPGLSQGAYCSGQLIAAVLAGHDGRRGYPKHIFVHPDFRRTNVGKRIMRRAVEALAHQGIEVCHYSVANSNLAAISFFQDCFCTPDFQLREITETRRFELRYVKATD